MYIRLIILALFISEKVLRNKKENYFQIKFLGGLRSKFRVKLEITMAFSGMLNLLRGNVEYFSVFPYLQWY